MKLKRIKCKIRPFKGVTVVYCGEHGLDEGAESFVEFVIGMGYIVYNHPGSPSELIIADKTLTYGDLRKMTTKLQIDEEWWDNETEFNSMKDQELDEVTL